MRNEVIYDKNGRPDIMVVFTPSELGLPDTLRGRKVKEYAISKYQNTLIDGVPYSLPFMKPAVNISHDEAIRLCESKGEGWHLITNDEWVALGFWSWDNDTMPTGNTASGKSHSHPEQTGTTYEGGCGKTLTGSGPVQWNHDGTAYGVADMCGNIWEHVGGVRFMNGMPQVIPNNGAAYGADQSKDSPEWEAIYTEGYVMEWFEMDDSPYTFAALTTNTNTDSENFNKFVDAVQAAKNVRSHIAGVFYYWQQVPDPGIGCALNTELHRYDFVKCGTNPRTATIGFVIKPSIETDPEVKPHLYGYTHAGTTTCGTYPQPGTLGAVVKQAAAADPDTEAFRYNYPECGITPRPGTLGSVIKRAAATNEKAALFCYPFVKCGTKRCGE